MHVSGSCRRYFSSNLETILAVGDCFFTHKLIPQYNVLIFHELWNK